MNSKVFTCALITDLRRVIIYPDKKDEAAEIRASSLEMLSLKYLRELRVKSRQLNILVWSLGERLELKVHIWKLSAYIYSI